VKSLPSFEVAAPLAIKSYIKDIEKEQAKMDETRQQLIAVAIAAVAIVAMVLLMLFTVD